MKADLYPDQDGFSKTWALEKRFEPATDAALADARYARWKQAVAATLSV
jgi:glycerol kinase